MWAGPASLLLALLVITACGAGHDGSAASFASLGAKGYAADFTPLESPEDALTKADLVVRGRLVDVIDGLTISYPDAATKERDAGSSVTLVIKVDHSLEADGTAPNTAYLQLPVAPSTSPGELSRANPQASILVLAENIDHWKPSPEARVDRPKGVPDEHSLFFAFNDGVWLQGPSDSRAVGVHAELDNLKPGWGKPRTVDDLTTALKAVR